MEDGTLLHTGTLVTPRRTLLGVLGQIERFGLPADEQRRLLVESGLPPIVLREPEVAVSYEQELAFLLHMLPRLDRRQSIVAHAVTLGLEVRATNFGMLGLTVMHAPSILECARVMFSYPELGWGHSRISVRLTDDALVQSYAVDLRCPGATAEENQALRDYCVTVDLTASIALNADVLGPGFGPLWIGLPYAAPPDAAAMVKRLGCPVRFDAPDARIAYPRSIAAAVPLRASPLGFPVYERMTRRLATFLRVELSVAEQVRRLLSTTTPPAGRDDVAKMMAMSVRTLTRKLADERTSYAALLREVRQARAREYLQSAGLSLIEIATRLGFSDATAFSRAFRAWEAESPAAWRERHHPVTPPLR